MKDYFLHNLALGSFKTNFVEICAVILHLCSCLSSLHLLRNLISRKAKASHIQEGALFSLLSVWQISQEDFKDIIIQDRK